MDMGDGFAAGAVTALAEVVTPHDEGTTSGGAVDAARGEASDGAGAAASARDAARALRTRRSGADAHAGCEACAANRGSWSVFMHAFIVD
ncbi:MAG: hypothetical protein ABTQ28_14870 [Thauera sp.]|jgi:hypothetical protein